MAGDSYNYHYFKVKSSQVEKFASTSLNVRATFRRVGTGYASRYTQTAIRAAVGDRFDLRETNYSFLSASELLKSETDNLVVMFDNQAHSKSSCLGHEATILSVSSANRELPDEEIQFDLWNTADENANFLEFGESIIRSNRNLFRRFNETLTLHALNLRICAIQSKFGIQTIHLFRFRLFNFCSHKTGTHDPEEIDEEIAAFEAKMRTDFKNGQFIVLRTCDSPAILNEQVTVYDIEPIVEELLQVVRYERGLIRTEFTRHFLDRVTWRFFLGRSHLMLLEDQVNYLRRQADTWTGKTSTFDSAKQLKEVHRISSIVTITKSMLNAIRLDVRRTKLKEQLGADERLDDWIYTVTCSAGDQFKRIEFEELLKDFQAEFPEHMRTSATILRELVFEKARTLNIHPNSFSVPQLAYLNRLVDQQKASKTDSIPNPIDYERALTDLNAFNEQQPGRALKHSRPIRRFVHHRAGGLVKHRRGNRFVFERDLSSEQQDCFYNIVESLKGRRTELSQEEKEELCEEINNEYPAIGAITVEYFTKRLSDLRTRMIKNGDKEAVRVHAGRYQYSNLQLAILNNSGLLNDALLDRGGYSTKKIYAWIRDVFNAVRLEGQREANAGKYAGAFSQLIKNIRRTIRHAKGLRATNHNKHYGTVDQPAGKDDFDQQYEQDLPDPFEIRLEDGRTIIKRQSEFEHQSHGRLIRIALLISDRNRNEESVVEFFQFPTMNGTNDEREPAADGDQDQRLQEIEEPNEDEKNTFCMYPPPCYWMSDERYERYEQECAIDEDAEMYSLTSVLSSMSVEEHSERV